MTIEIFVYHGGGERFWCLVYGWGRGGGNCVTNYLVHFTPFLSVNFKVEKMSDVFCLFQDSANLKTDVG